MSGPSRNQRTPVKQGYLERISQGTSRSQKRRLTCKGARSRLVFRATYSSFGEGSIALERDRTPAQVPGTGGTVGLGRSEKKPRRP